MFKGKFIDNLPKIYGTYTGGFLVFIILMAIAEQAGMTAKTIGILFVAFTVCIYAFIGWSLELYKLMRTMLQEDRFQLYLMVWQLRLTGCQVLRLLLWQVEFTSVGIHTWHS